MPADEGTPALDEKALKAAWSEFVNCVAYWPPEWPYSRDHVDKMLAAVIREYLAASAPAVPGAPRCDCGHTHASGSDGEDLGCSICSCATFHVGVPVATAPVAWGVQREDGGYDVWALPMPTRPGPGVVLLYLAPPVGEPTPALPSREAVEAAIGALSYQIAEGEYEDIERAKFTLLALIPTAPEN